MESIIVDDYVTEFDLVHNLSFLFYKYIGGVLNQIILAD